MSEDGAEISLGLWSETIQLSDIERMMESRSDLGWSKGDSKQNGNLRKETYARFNIGIIKMSDEQKIVNVIEKLEKFQTGEIYAAIYFKLENSNEYTVSNRLLKSLSQLGVDLVLR